jgi:hypothetical protein
MSNLKVNTINDANGTSNAVLYGVAAPTGSMGFRNRILNGDCRIDQRNAGAATANTISGYTLDRWAVSQSTTGKLIAQQNAGSVTPPAGFTNYLGVTSQSAFSVGSGDYYMIYQMIEGYNVADFGLGAAGAATFTISFWVRSSLTGTFGGSLQNNANNRSYPFTYTISAANTWEQKTVTVAGDTTGTWEKTNSTGLRLNFGLGVGSTYSGTAGSWAGSNLITATGATSVVGTNGATFYITGVQLEAGSVASPFERRDYGRELMMCQRYFCMTFSQGTAPASNAGQGGALLTLNGSGTGVSVGLLATWFFPVEMRTGPSVVTTYNPSAAGSSWFLNTGGTVAAATANPGTRGVTVYNNATSTSGTNAAIHVTASAEL